MAFSTVNSEDQLVQQTFADHLRDVLGWETAYAWKQETFGPNGTLGRTDTREAVLHRDLRAAMVQFNPELPSPAIDQALRELTSADHTRSLVQHNQTFYQWIREGVPVTYRDLAGRQRSAKVRVIDFEHPDRNRFLAVRELQLQGLRTPNYNRRADLVCFVNGLPLVFIELKSIHLNIRHGFDENLSDYMHESVIAHAFYHNAFLVVSNGHRARYGSITSSWEHFAEWKRNDESDKGDLDAKVLLNGMLAKDGLLDIVQNFMLFDASRAGPVRKVVARNQQVLGVNLAVQSVRRQEELKARIPAAERLVRRTTALAVHGRAILGEEGPREVEFVERADPALGQLGVFWHTQGSGKSYSMVFFSEKVRRTIPGNFTFVLMTDRVDLDNQLHKTFIGCAAADEQTPRAASGKDLRRLLQENHRYIFSVIHKFNQDIDPDQPYSLRDDIIVISDEAHRTQGGKLARNMRMALPNASFIGFTGTPLFKNDHLTRRLFGHYVSRYDFKRSEQDGSTVKLVYANRGEKLGLARIDLNDAIAEAIEQADLDDDQRLHLEKLLGKDYEVLTAAPRLDRIAADFVAHCSSRWQAGKSMLVCLDKLTCAKMLQRIEDKWPKRIMALDEAALAEPDPAKAELLRQQAQWMRETVIGLVISEAQNEVKDFKAQGFNIIPHRARMKLGFDTPDGNRLDLESAFKAPAHPFRVAVVCAMWLTGFDVESLATLYIDKPMKAHTLMQAIARANRRFGDKEYGLIVDYNGMLQSLRRALAQYAVGDGADAVDIVAPIEDQVSLLVEALEATEAFLAERGFAMARLHGAKGFARIEALSDAVEVVVTDDETRRRFELLARLTFSRFRALASEPAIYAYVARHDDLECIYKKLDELREPADVGDILQELQRIVSEAIATHEPGDDQFEERTYDLSRIDFDRLQREFRKRVSRPATVLLEIRLLVEQKLAQMLQQNPLRMDFYQRYTQIIAEYNSDKDRVTVEDTFERLIVLIEGMNTEQERAVREGLSEEELALFDLLKKDSLTQTERERLKLASRQMLADLERLILTLDQWTSKPQTQGAVESLVADKVYQLLPAPAFSDPEKAQLAQTVYRHVWQRSAAGFFPVKKAA